MTEQVWNADVYRTNARFVSDLGMPVVELLAPRAGERILDLGCGDGVLTKKLQDMGCEMVGIDSSPELVEAASAPGLEVYIQDATAMEFVEEFDAVFSNAVLHWVKDPDEVIRRVFRALRPGGRFVHRQNVSAITSGPHRRGRCTPALCREVHGPRPSG